ncbi:MAG: hypothetical protein JWN30_1599, partial [Bacilli bacterium]|nr:hypothetical protein [Bacilli bacterium]
MTKHFNKIVPLLASTALLIGLAGCGTSSSASAKADPNAPVT